MSQLPARSRTFLQEMGIGVQWKLRDAAEGGLAEMDAEPVAPAVATPDPFVAAVQAMADQQQEGFAPDVRGSIPVSVSAPVTPLHAQGAGVMAGPAAVAEVGLRSPMAPAPDATPVRAAPDTAPHAAAPHASAPQPPAKQDDDSMAWFDDAPVPPPTAAPARPAAGHAAASARPAAVPAAAAASAQSTPAVGKASARVTDVAPSDAESTAWFDDAPAPSRPAPVSDEAIAAMDWPALRAAVSSCTRCPLCETRRAAVNGRGADNAGWMAIATSPSRLDEKDVQPVTGEAGQLLGNMLKAIELQPDADVYVTNLVKCRPSTPDGADRAPGADELLACRPYLHRELALTGAKMAMTFGQFAAKGLMMGPAARGKVMRYGAGDLPVVATYHPDDLLRKPEDKAKAWGDLCLAKASHG